MGKGNGDGGIDIVVEALAEGWVMIRAEITPTSDRRRIPALINKTLVAWLKANPNVKVNASSSIVEDGDTTAVHLWFQV